MRLLIVEDEPEIALMIEDVAVGAGFEITGIAGTSQRLWNSAPKQTSPSSTSGLGMASPWHPVLSRTPRAELSSPYRRVPRG